jgi:mono/diheme cytochrome c family protein
MRLVPASLLCLTLFFTACSRNSGSRHTLRPKAYGTEITEVSGGKQITEVGSETPQPVVVQVNGADGTPVTGALVSFHGDGVRFTDAQALTDASGQVTTAVRLGTTSGLYQIVAETPVARKNPATIKLQETALGYEQKVGKAVDEIYCVRCHSSESTPERVSNFDNLSPSPHQFSDGAALNTISDADLINTITHGGLAVGKSAQMPAYGATLTPAEIRAVIAYMRVVADPPYQTPGVKYGKD